MFGILKNEEVKRIPKIKKEKIESESEDEKAHQQLEMNFKEPQKRVNKDLDEDEIAEILAIGKKMLRKRN